MFGQLPDTCTVLTPFHHCRLCEAYLEGGEVDGLDGRPREDRLLSLVILQEWAPVSNNKHVPTAWLQFLNRRRVEGKLISNCQWESIWVRNGYAT